MKPAQRLNLVQEYYFSRKLKEVAALNAAGKDIISLAIGSPDMPPSPATIDRLCEVAHDPAAHGYQPTMGTPELRTAMAGFYQRWFGVSLDPKSEVLPLIGSKEGILHVTLAFVNPGDKVLVPNPGYPTYTSLSRLLGAEVVNYDLLPEKGYQPDFKQLEAMDTTDVRLLWVNYPNMPTGAPAQRATYERLVRFAQKRDIVIVNDNPYSFILGHEYLSILQIPGAKDCCIEFNSMSKSHNMPGWRVGMLATNATFCQWILKVKSNIDSGTFRAIQLAAATAYDNSDEWHQTFNVSLYARRRHLAEQIMTALGCTFDPHQVGMFLWGRIPDTIPDDVSQLSPSTGSGTGYASPAEVVTENVLQDARVFITPGFIFGSNGNRYIRISLCATEEKLADAFCRIQAMEK